MLPDTASVPSRAGVVVGIGVATVVASLWDESLDLVRVRTQRGKDDAGKGAQCDRLTTCAFRGYP